MLECTDLFRHIRSYRHSTIKNYIIKLLLIYLQFLHRHVGPNEAEKKHMLNTLGFDSMEALIQSTVPGKIRLNSPIVLDAPLTESEAISTLKTIMSKNKVLKSFIGMGYYETITPPVIQRNILEAPGWYTSYTPYQAEISQGRMESLLNFQTMVADLTGMDVCNASLLDESTAAAEAMTMCHAISNHKKHKFFVDENCHPHNISLMQTRAPLVGIELIVGSIHNADFSSGDFCGAIVQNPNTYGEVVDLSDLSAAAHKYDTKVVAIADLMASTLIKSSGEMGVDIVVGSAQRFGVPMVLLYLTILNIIFDWYYFRVSVDPMPLSWLPRRHTPARCLDALSVLLRIVEASLHSD